MQFEFMGGVQVFLKTVDSTNNYLRLQIFNKRSQGFGTISIYLNALAVAPNSKSVSFQVYQIQILFLLVLAGNSNSVVKIVAGYVRRKQTYIFISLSNIYTSQSKKLRVTTVFSFI